MPFLGIERDFGGEVRKFDLNPLGAWEAVEQDCNAGLGKVLGRLWSTMARKIVVDEGGGEGFKEVPHPEAFDFYGRDIRSVLFHALKGGGMPDDQASKLVRLHFDAAPGGKAQFARLALEIADNWWNGTRDLPGKASTP